MPEEIKHQQQVGQFVRLPVYIKKIVQINQQKRQVTTDQSSLKYD